MSSFLCDKCGTAIIDSERGYVTSCEHFKAEEANKFRPKYIDERCSCHAGKICSVHKDEVMREILKERFKNRVVAPDAIDDMMPPNSIDDSPVDVKELASKRFVVNNINDLIDKIKGKYADVPTSSDDFASRKEIK
mgnify:CR=1 FL=1